MSMFRSPQVPQQPPRFFTPGQPLGIPVPRIDAQMAQFEAYYRQHVEIQQPQVFKTAAAPLSYVPPLPLQVPATPRWAMEWIVENYSVEFTPGLPLGTPLPRQTDQTQATWRCRAEIQQPQIFAAVAAPIVYVPAPDFFGFEATAEQPPQQPPTYAVQSAPQVFVPALPLQSLPSTRWALEWIVENYGAEFTPGQPLGVPQPKQSEQTAAYWRQRIETIQPAASQIYPPAAAAYVPPAIVPAPQNISWRFEWLIDFLQPEFVPQQLSGFVPPVALQMPFAAQRNEWPILQQQRITAGIALGVPQPRQSDQSAAYYRQHVEIQQPIYFSTLGIQLIKPIRVKVTFADGRTVSLTDSRKVALTDSRKITL